jgi:hypothetical protein
MFLNGAAACQMAAYLAKKAHQCLLTAFLDANPVAWRCFKLVRLAVYQIIVYM